MITIEKKETASTSTGPREDVASAYSLFQGRKTGWVGEKRKIG